MARSPVCPCINRLVMPLYLLLPLLLRRIRQLLVGAACAGGAPLGRRRPCRCRRACRRACCQPCG